MLVLMKTGRAMVMGLFFLGIAVATASAQTGQTTAAPKPTGTAAAATGTPTPKTQPSAATNTAAAVAKALPSTPLTQAQASAKALPAVTAAAAALRAGDRSKVRELVTANTDPAALSVQLRRIGELSVAQQIAAAAPRYRIEETRLSWTPASTQGCIGTFALTFRVKNEGGGKPSKAPWLLLAPHFTTTADHWVSLPQLEAGEVREVTTQPLAATQCDFYVSATMIDVAFANPLSILKMSLGSKPPSFGWASYIAI